ncbi:hypothetical protein [Enterobacter roggenkampii]|uniref:hypothetical protein n=1 Tax=Enterobacter roggenkampii TaxID=1812935 RepID=UPI000FCBC38B|nr:hypothetical protein [Enterobacter roggenkampii]
MKWEFAAYFDQSSGSLIELITKAKDDQAEPSLDVILKALKGDQIVVHHNHLSQESLSKADWNGANRLFNEIFAHCTDGTKYWGKVISFENVAKIILEYVYYSTEADNALVKVLQNHSLDHLSTSGLFTKEIINRAMKIKQFVEYEYVWGTQNLNLPYNVSIPYQYTDSIGHYGKAIDSYIDNAAVILATKM